MQPQSALDKAQSAILLEKGKYNATNNRYKVLDELSDFRGFLLKTPREHDILIKRWNKMFPTLFWRKAKNGHYKKTAFCERILKALNYEGFREKYAKEIASIINLKTCPYCNAALTIVANSSIGKKKARFQLDHYYAKSKHPLFCISFFNLIPSCGNCNQSKGSKNVLLGKDFHLYTEANTKDLFEFEIPKQNVAKFIFSKNREDIEIVFKSGSSGNDKNTIHHNNAFDIDGIYETQKDVAEELILKHLAYSKSQIDDLSNLLKLPSSVINRMVIGNYVDREDIHKRPLAKFTQDIARQLGLIK